MQKQGKNSTERRAFASISQDDLPHGRHGKHFSIVAEILRDLETLSDGRALKIPLAELPDSKANIRSALNRASKLRKLEIATSSDDGHLYIWKPKLKA
ncbi:MAG: hypothetical protein ROO76_05110 [Terriglobia bacterium]|jgi:hypothetical protein|nr:hypothetical protein [Terriglobia bacterium]